MLNWCIIGSGDVVQRLLKKSIEKKNKSTLKYILSKDINSAKKYAENFENVQVLESSLKNIKLIQNNKLINSIYIATPPNSHYYYIEKLSNKKNIICEKPLFINKKEIKNFKRLIKTKKFNFYTCFYRRYLERFLFVKKILKQKKIGKILYFDIKYFHNEKNHPTANIIRNKPIPWRFVKNVSGGGNIFDMGAHSIDLINFMIGEIKSVSAFKKNQMNFYNVEDINIVNFELKNKILGQASWCSTSPFKVDKFIIYGRKGTINFTMNFGEEDHVVIKLKNKIVKKKIKMKMPLHNNMFNYFIKELTKKNKTKKSHIDQNGITNAEILQKIS